MNKEGLEKLDINNSSKNIVIVGNGFDMSLGLKSSYQNFIEYIKSRKKFAEDYELYNYNRLFLRKYENFRLNWSDFESIYEETVRKINKRSQKNEEPQDIFDIASVNDSIKRLEEDFHEYLLDEYPRWIEQKTITIGDDKKKFTEKVNPFFKKMIKDENTFFINFNYTNTIEDLCESVLYDSSKVSESNLKVRKAKKRVFHIHGSLEDENILFGGGFTDSEDIDKIHYSQSLINDKLFRIKENDSLNLTRKKIMSTIDLNNEDTNNDLFIIGHSLQGSDFPFLSKLIQKSNKVFIFYYEDDYIIKMEEILRKFGSSIAEKIVLVPFLEILLSPERLIVSNYKHYQTINSFLLNKFPREDILSEFSLTMDHFALRNINELRISPSNTRRVLRIAENLVLNKNASKISRVYFEGTIDSIDFNKLDNEYFLMLLKWVSKITFSNTEIDSDFFIQLLKNCSNLACIRMENCTLVNGYDESADISICESLRRLEIINCSSTSNLSDTRKSIFYIKSDKQNNIEKLILRNNNLVIKKEVLEKSANLKELNILITNEENVYEEEIHLKNLEILHIDHSSGLVPNITIGNKIEEIVLIGYSDKLFKLSSIMRSNKESVGFPKLRLFHLKTPDQMTSCRNLIVDVNLDVFSNDTKFIVDKDIKTIEEYYKKYRNPHIHFFNNIEGLMDNNILLKLKDLFLEISSLTNQTIIEELLEEVSTKIKTIKQTGQDIEQKDVNGSNQNNEYDSGRKSVTNKYTKIDILLFDYSKGDKTALKEIFDVLQQQEKAEIVTGIYHGIANKIDHLKINTKEDVLELKRKSFTQARDKVIKDFSEEWFVSKDALYLSAIQYDVGDDSIPNIGRIIISKDYEGYKAKHLEANTFKHNEAIKHTKAMKQDWKKVLDEKIVWLNEELKNK